MSAIHTLSVVIGATLQGGFGATMASGKNQLMQLGQTIKQLETSSKSITTFQNLHRDMLVAKRNWADAENQVRSLGQQMSATTAPSKAMQTEFDKSATAALKAKNAYVQKRSALHELRGQLQSGGHDMQNLVAEQTKLGASIANLKAHYAGLDLLMQKRQGVLARRAQLHGELMDAVALGVTLMAPINAAIDFEAAMNKVRRSVQIDNPVAFQKLGETFQVMSRTVPVSAEGLAQIAASGGKLGITAQHIAGFTKNIATMSMAFNMPADDIGATMAKLTAVYKMSMSQMMTFGDALQVLSRKMMAKPEEIILALQKMGAAARQCGLSAIQASALASSLISLGRAPEKAGTSIQLFLTKLSTATQQSKKFKNALSRMGYSATTLTKSIGKDAQGAILQFLETLSKLDKQKRTGVLVDLFGMRAQGDVALLVNSLDTYKKALGSVNKESLYAGTLQQTLVNRSKTAAMNFQLFKNVLAEIGITMGTVLLPPLTSLLQLLRSVIAPIADMMRLFPGLTKMVIGTTAALMGLKVGAVGLGYAWTFVQGAGLAAATAWKVMTIAFATNPIGATVAALALVATLVITNWKTVQAFFMKIWEPIKPIWEAFKQWVGSFWDSIAKPFHMIGTLWGKAFGTHTETTKQSPQMHTIKEAIKAPLPLKSQAKTINNTKQNITVNVHASPHHDTRKIADEVMRRLTFQNRSALYDPVSAS